MTSKREESKVWVEEEIIELLETNPKAVMRGIVAIYKLQTPEEQEGEHTDEINGVGFNRFDAPFLSSLARQILEGRFLTSKQLEAGRKGILKYRKQLLSIANKEIQVVS